MTCNDGWLPFHEWLLQQERRLTMQHELPLPSSDTDLPFGAPENPMPPLWTQCAQCGEVVHQENVVVKTVHTGPRSTMTEHFCGRSCFEDWYLNRLRSFGL